jgi:hypothetical protein
MHSLLAPHQPSHQVPPDITEFFDRLSTWWSAKPKVAGQRAGGRRAGKALNPPWIGQSSADSGTKPALLPTSDHPSI